MALVTENGTIVANANSYVTDAEYVAYAAARGYTIGSDATAREIELTLAIDYLESYREDYKGFKVSGNQSLQWPRYNVFVDSYHIDSNAIPSDLKNAQMEAARLVAEGVDLSPSGSIENVQSESIGSMSVSYFNGGTWQSVQHKNIDKFLDVLLESGGKLSTVRV